MAACDGQQIGHVDTHVGMRVARTHAKQSVRPARRREVLRRDGGRCCVPGCRHATFFDVHHLRLRSEDGDDEVENLITLCSAHHRAIHDGRLLVEGSPRTGLRFRHADGTTYGAAPSPGHADVRAKAFRALTHMGFRASEAKHALGRVPTASAMTLDALVRQTLRLLA